MIDEQKSFIYMNQTDGWMMCADIDIVQNNFTKQQCSECDGQAAGQMNI